jgi:hypothetical protein
MSLAAVRVWMNTASMVVLSLMPAVSVSVPKLIVL